jgi:hypothetical protein
MSITLAGFLLALVIPLGPGPVPITADLSVYLHASGPDHVRIPIANHQTGAFALPWGYYAMHAVSHDLDIRQEERLHIRQWEALGPLYLVAYLLTAGDPFEPYDPRHTGAWSKRPSGTYGVNHDAWNLDHAWQPDSRRFPQLRLTLHPDRSGRIEFMPGYNLGLW